MNSESEKEIVSRVLEGSRDAFNQIYATYYTSIYNFCYRVSGDREEATDFAQEVFIKVFLHLKDFRFEGALKNWIFRVARNHLYDKVPFRNEKLYMDQLKYDLTEPEENAEEAWVRHELVEETKNKCLTGVLFCLSREQRMIYILGAIFKIGHENGAEIFGVSKANFRKKLSRARAELNNFLESRCGLIHHQNPCRCFKKTNKLIELGLVDKEIKEFTPEYQRQIKDAVQEHVEGIELSVDDAAGQLYEKLPYYQPQTHGKDMLKELLTEDLAKRLNLL